MALQMHEKIERATSFLIAFGYRRVMSAMRSSGFSPADLEEGWRRAQTAATPWLEEAPGAEDTPAARKALAELDDLENEHFPVIDATLVHRYPAIHKRVIGGLSQTSGPALLLTMPKLVQNIRALEEAGDADSRAARALLARRGLSGLVVERVEALIAEASAADLTPAPISDEDLARERATRDANVERLWTWYLEWSTIARARIKNGQVLSMLGFGHPGRPARAAVDEDETPATPALPTI